MDENRKYSFQKNTSLPFIKLEHCLKAMKYNSINLGLSQVMISFSMLCMKPIAKIKPKSIHFYATVH